MGGDDMRYFEIGQRIRRYRKACGLSQEALAGRVGISVTHMSHIETGNTKLSLPVLTKIADELSVGTDALLSDAPKPDKAALSAEVQEVLDSFEADELPVAIEVLRALRDALAKRRG
ncbi:helix-turn-helix domain-containing protein [Adlercreutzia sp.]|uniref:helix-turn-helix domain-containing protein n=1 Tax=Adlercreutzia sp. TaxID=1872387 RepID=UPI002F956ABD